MQYAWRMAYGVWRMSSKINKIALSPRTCWHPRCRGRPRCCIWDNSTPWLPVTRSLPARTKHTSRQTTAVRQPPSDNRRQTTARQTTARQTTARQTTARQTTARQTTAVRQPPVRQPPVRQPPVRQPPVRRHCSRFSLCMLLPSARSTVTPSTACMQSSANPYV